MSFKHTKECASFWAGAFSAPRAFPLAQLLLPRLMLAMAPALTLACKNTTSIPSPGGKATPAPSNSPNPVAKVPAADPGKSVVDPGENSLPVGNNDLDGPEAFRAFDFAEPALNSGKSTARKLKLWATFYYIPKIVSSSSQDTILRGSAEQNLLQNEKISKKEWCDLALQGSGRVIKSTGEKLTISFSERSKSNPVMCNGFIGVASIIEKVKGNRFAKVDSVFGRGARVKEVVPYRTIAVDPKVVKYGSVIYIPGARGKAVTFESGAQSIHDGYFFAGDTGSAIIGNHIDVFTGTVKKQPFDFVKSAASGAFEAYVIEDASTRNKLSTLHQFSN